MLRAIAIAVLATALVPGVARGTPWRWPVRGRVVGSFSVTPDDPYAAGQRRGIAIAAAPGTIVSSACAGRVAFAGSVGRAGPTLSVQCAGLRATYQGLGAIGVGRGAVVLASQRVGRLGAAGVLRLGARRAGPGPHGAPRYVDPAGLLGGGPLRPPLGLAPRPRRRRVPQTPRRPPVVVAPAPEPVVVAAPAAGVRAPAVAWLGLALLGLAAPVGGLWRRRRRRRSRLTARAASPVRK